MMAQPMAGAIGVLVLLALLLGGMPIGVALGLVGLAGLSLTIGLEPALIKSAVLLFETLTRYELGTLPLFMLMAHLCFVAEASRDFFDVAARMLGHRRGGLAIASRRRRRSGSSHCRRCAAAAMRTRSPPARWRLAARWVK